MREIEFRGKNDANEWLYGYLTHPAGNDCPIIDGKDYFGGVIENTVGQYIGLKDKNGTKIFEGDFVKDQYGFIHEIRFGRIGWESGVGLTGFVRVSKFETVENDEGEEFYTCDRCVDLTKLEVVGNIHDNPELLTPDEM